MRSPVARRWARLGLYIGLAVAVGITLDWALAAGRADWADWRDDPAVDAQRYAAAVSFPLSLLAFALAPVLKQFAYWPLVVVLGPPLNGMTLGALAGYLRDRTGTRGPWDLTTPPWTTTGLLAVGVPVLWTGLVGVVVVVLAAFYLGPFDGLASLLARSQEREAAAALLSVTWLALPLGPLLIREAVPTAWRWLLWFLLLGAAVFAAAKLVPHAPILRHLLAWLVIGFGAFVAVPSPASFRLTRVSLRYALIVCATPFLVLTPLSVPAILLLGLELWTSRRRDRSEPAIPPVRLAQWGCVAVALPLCYALLGRWLGAPALTVPHRWLGSAESTAQIGLLAGALLIQTGVWRTARPRTAPAVAPPGPAPELAWAGLILAGLVFVSSLAASTAGLHQTRRTVAMQLVAGVLMYLSARAASWPVPRVFGATIALLALHALLLAPLLMAIR